MTELAPEPAAGPVQIWACLQCVTEHKLALHRGVSSEDAPPIQVAVTLAPTMTPVGAVAVPSCMGHINVGGGPGLLLAQPGMPAGGR
ncbi:hypothetical protein [Actinoallomurus sp. NPDC052274]|uniref:hypothetical protein n=1 Tax=Actinoallomurus sp. NPDC052274 TaxID=3155420 RepID=UPI003436322F